MKRITALILCLLLFCSHGYGQQKISDGSRDHGAARLDLSNVPDDSVVTRHMSPQEYLDFITGAEPPAYLEGRLFWDKDHGCPAFYPDMPGPIMQVGQEFWVRVKNPGVATMTNGSVVCLNEPDTGNDPVAVLADAASIDTAKIIGVVTADISPDSSGYAAIFGPVRDINTAGFTPGARVFLAAGSPGTFTETVPAAPNYSVVVGYVMKAHATAGSIYVRPWINGALDRAQFASTLAAATGTAAAPAYSFASDPNTGVYSPAADNLGVSVGGVQVATFAATGLGLTPPLTISNGGTGKTTAAEALAALGGASLNGSSTVNFTAKNASFTGDTDVAGKVKAGDGTAAAPAYTFSSDPNTGMYSPAADNLGVSIAGAEALRVNSAGEMLIATSTDAGDYKLQVDGNARIGSIYCFAPNFELGFERVATGSAYIDMRTDGVYTDYGSRVIRYGSENGALDIINRGTGGISLYNADAGAVKFYTAGAEAARISAGEMLIATSTDAGDYKLQVNGDAYVNGNVLVGTTIDDGTSKLRVNGRIYNSFLDATSTQRVYKSDVFLVMATNDVIPINSALSSAIPPGKRVGRVDVTECNAGYITSYALRGGTDTAVEGFDPANIFSPTFDSADTINICYSATAANYVIQNKRASTIRLHISFVGQ